MTSQYRGVTYSKKSAKWQAAINMGGTHVHLGTYVSEQEAAIAFDRAALIVRGLDKAKINFPVTNYCDATGQLVVDPSTASKLQAGAEKQISSAGADGSAEGGSKKRRKRMDSSGSLLGLGGGDASGYANYLGSLISGAGGGFDGGDGGQFGAALLQQYMQYAQAPRGRLDDGAVWAGVMAVASTCLPPGSAPEEDGSETTGQPRLLGMIPHLASRAMGVVWEQEAEGDGELSEEGRGPPQVGAAVWQNGAVLCRQLHNDEGAARDWLASMMELLAGMGSSQGAGNAAASAAVTPLPGGFPPLATSAEAHQQQQLAELLGAGAKLQQQQQMEVGMAELLAAAGAGPGGAEALSALLAAAAASGGGGGGDGSGADISGLLALAAASAYGNPGGGQGGGMDLVALLAAVGGGSESMPAAAEDGGEQMHQQQQQGGESASAGEPAAAGADLADAAPLMMLAGLMQEDSVAAAAAASAASAAAPPSQEPQPQAGGGGSLPLFRAQ